MAQLSAEVVAAYHRAGYHYPVRVLSEAGAAALRRKLEAAERADGLPAGALRSKSHLLFTWVDALVRNEALLDAVESLIGPDILVWGTSFFIKEPHNKSYVSWHQDLTYWGLEPAEIVTAWVAISDSTSANGAMRVIPGTHTLAVVEHRDTFAADNLLSRGQEIAVTVDERRAVSMELAAGEMSLHHVKLIHGSEPNHSSDRRIGLAIRYIPTHVRQVAGSRDSGMLVRGVDRHRNFAPEQQPQTDLSAAALSHYAEVARQTAGILMRGTGRTG